MQKPLFPFVCLLLGGLGILLFVAVLLLQHPYTVFGVCLSWRGFGSND